MSTREIKRAAAFSDAHGDLPEDKHLFEDFDYVFFAGDLFPLFCQRNNAMCESWLNEIFIPWCKNFNENTKIIIIAGNHDFFFESYSDKFRKMIEDIPNVVYLENETFEDSFIQVYGTPLCHRFGNWAFMPSDENIENIFKDAPNFSDGKTSIILSHDAPFGYSDICFEAYWIANKHVGSEPLYNLMEDKKPDWLIHGHLHSANHEIEHFEKTKVVNTIGAGDTHVGTLIGCLTEGMDWKESLKKANKMAALSVVQRRLAEK